MNECLDELIVKDDWGENDCTFCCEKPPGHKGKHRHSFDDKWAMEWGSKIEREANDT